MTETPFRIYTLSDEGAPECVCSTDEFSVGEALLELHRKGRVLRGIMYRPDDERPGEWLLSPWESRT